MNKTRRRLAKARRKTRKSNFQTAMLKKHPVVKQHEALHQDYARRIEQKSDIVPKAPTPKALESMTKKLQENADVAASIVDSASKPKRSTKKVAATSTEPKAPAKKSAARSSSRVKAASPEGIAAKPRASRAKKSA